MTTQHTTGITAGTCDCKVVTIQKKYGKGIRIESATWEPCALHANAAALLEAAKAALAASHDPVVERILLAAIAAIEGRKE